MPIDAGGILVVDAATTRCLSSATGMLRFLARLSGRRRHVRRFRSCSTSSGPGAATAAGQRATTAAVMDPEQRQQQQQQQQQQRTSPDQDDQDRPYCCRCRCRCCSCSFLGLDDEDEDEVRPPRVHDRTTTPASARRRPAGSGRPPGTTAHRHASSPTADRDVLRRRPPERRRRLGTIIPPYLATLFILFYGLAGMADACSSRSTPKPRPPTPTPRPNITFHMYTCPPDYAEWYCLNGATCFTVKIVNSLLYNCICANGYIGQRCEFKDLDGSYLPSRQRVMLETASIAGAVTIAVFLAVITFISVYIHCKRKQKELRTSSGVDAEDGPGRDPELRPFCSRSRSLMIFMAKNSNSSTTTPSIEQTRMPNWNYPAESSMRITCINENKRPSQ